MLVRNFTFSELEKKKKTSLEWIWSRKQMHRQRQSDSYLLGMWLCSWLSSNLKSSPKVLKCFQPARDATPKIIHMHMFWQIIFQCQRLTSTCCRIFLKIEDEGELGQHFSVESEGVLSEPGRSDSYFVFLCLKPNWQKAEALFLVCVCCYYASLFVHSSDVPAVLQIGFYLFLIYIFT